MRFVICKYILSGIFLYACNKPVHSGNTIIGPYAADTTVIITTDKACYNPGETVSFTINKSLPQTAKIRYRQLSTLISEINVSSLSWNWTAPATDFTGYMVDVYNIENGTEKIYGSTAVDVSSDWSRFPRYGFLSWYGQIPESSMDSVINSINRYHINGVQFQDWEYKHHLPLAGTISNPSDAWKDIANRYNYKATVQYYINGLHMHNIKAMSYNQAYAALSDAAADGVSEQWYMFTDQAHSNKEVIPLPSPQFKSNLYLLDPSNAGWQNYISGKTNDAYTVYNFDGYQVDQMGNLNKNLYSYSGAPVNLDNTFLSFLQSMKSLTPSKKMVMNAVSQYGEQVSITKAPVDFLYTEVWPPDEAYNDLRTIIQNNDAWSNYTKKTVLAAYMNYNVANNKGYFNTPGVLLADAVIFALGGSHLELGDHMLCKEYFPNTNLQMKPDLQESIIHYYDFLAGYENILRDGGTFNNPSIISSDGKVMLNNWPPQTGSISIIGKDIGTRQVVHFINLANANSFDWRDTNGTQVVPNTFQNLSFVLTLSKPVSKLWTASPDTNGGVLQSISFKQSGNSISFTLPSLQYWDMLVVEY
jgi:dextranase